MANIGQNDADERLFRAFGERLKAFVAGRIGPTEAADKIGVSKQLLNRYLKVKEMEINGKAVVVYPEAGLRLIFGAFTKLGIVFEYEGYRIRAEKLDGTPIPPAVSQQSEFKFNRTFNLPEDKGEVRVDFNRPPGRVKLSVSLKANAS